MIRRERGNLVEHRCSAFDSLDGPDHFKPWIDRPTGRAFAKERPRADRRGGDGEEMEGRTALASWGLEEKERGARLIRAGMKLRILTPGTSGPARRCMSSARSRNRTDLWEIDEEAGARGAQRGRSALLLRMIGRDADIPRAAASTCSSRI